MKEAKRSLIEVIIGIWFLAVVVILAGVFFVPSKIPYVLGEVTGSFYIAEWIMPYTVLAGLFGRKFAPFLVPVMERFRLRNETGDSAMIK